MFEPIRKSIYFNHSNKFQPYCSLGNCKAIDLHINSMCKHKNYSTLYIVTREHNCKLYKKLKIVLLNQITNNKLPSK